MVAVQRMPFIWQMTFIMELVHVEKEFKYLDYELKHYLQIPES